MTKQEKSAMPSLANRWCVSGVNKEKFARENNRTAHALRAGKRPIGAFPRSGDLFIIINKSRNCAILLRWEPGEHVLFYNRLESW